MTETTETKTTNKKLIIGVIALVAVVALLAVCYLAFGPKATAGAKTITIEVIDDEQQSVFYKLETDAEFLRQAMEEMDGLEFSGEESEFGLTIYTVNGVTADYNKDGAYWNILVNGEYGNYGVDSQPVADGDAYQIVYTVFVGE